MLFNSYVFIFLFLPVVLIGFHLIGRAGLHQAAIAWLLGASLFFYGWWNPVYLTLIIGSVVFNYTVGIGLCRVGNSKLLLGAGIAANLLLLGYFKYANFFVDNLNTLAATQFHLETIILPLAISFFTFQQIAFLVDVYRDKIDRYNFLHYALFVCFFPQLIAGPIVHHSEIQPQFVRAALYRIRSKHLAVGFSIFAIGLFKKAVIADGVALYATPIFDAANNGEALSFLEAWSGALAYSFQLYFDFSGYSDMAIGLARMFGVRLPRNFNSPYKATSIIDFWRRWHMTLSRFLRDYLYYPLGGNRKGETRRMANLMLTMILGGLWHGAGWTFILWGGLHGLYLVINNIWRRTIRRVLPHPPGHFLLKLLSWLITFLAVVIAWIPFRAADMNSTLIMLKGMAGLNGFALPENLLSPLNALAGLGDYLAELGIRFSQLAHFNNNYQFAYFALLSVIAFLLPNTQEFMHRYRPALKIHDGEIAKPSWRVLEWRLSAFWALLVGLITYLAVLMLDKQQEFLYFNF